MWDLEGNDFELFGLPVGFTLDLDLLARRYRELQQAAHPDRHAGTSPQQQRLAVQRAGRINDAYQTLRDPLRRAVYLLALGGAPLDAGPEPPPDPLFLMEQMEQRERLAAVRSEPDPRVAVQAILSASGSREQALFAELAHCLERQDLGAARERVRKLQFLAKLRTQGEELEAELDDAAPQQR